jgi:hypothetical protein
LMGPPTVPPPIEMLESSLVGSKNERALSSSWLRK